MATLQTQHTKVFIISQDFHSILDFIGILPISYLIVLSGWSGLLLEKQFGNYIEGFMYHYQNMKLDIIPINRVHYIPENLWLDSGVKYIVNRKLRISSLKRLKCGTESIFLKKQNKNTVGGSWECSKNTAILPPLVHLD